MEIDAVQGGLSPDTALQAEVEELSGQHLELCYQCRKCSGGCPLAFAMDVRLNEVIRLVQVGDWPRLAQSAAMWLCVGCRTCQARCPNGIDGSRVMDALKALARRDWAIREESAVAPSGRPAGHEVAAFNSSFLATVRGFGRAHELGLTALFKLKTRTYTRDVGLGLQLFRRRKLNVLPSRVRRMREVRTLFRRAEVRAR